MTTIFLKLLFGLFFMTQQAQCMIITSELLEHNEDSPDHALALKHDLIDKNSMLRGFFPHAEISTGFSIEEISFIGNGHVILCIDDKKVEHRFSYQEQEEIELRNLHQDKGQFPQQIQARATAKKIPNKQAPGTLDAFYGEVISPFGFYAACKGPGDSIVITDRITSNAIATLGGHVGYPAGSMLFVDEHTFVSAPGSAKRNGRVSYEDNNILVYDIQTGSVLSRLSCDCGKELPLCLSPDGLYLATFYIYVDYTSDSFSGTYAFNPMVKIWRSFASLSLEQLKVLDMLSRVPMLFFSYTLTPAQQEILRNLPAGAYESFLSNYKIQHPYLGCAIL